MSNSSSVWAGDRCGGFGRLSQRIVGTALAGTEPFRPVQAEQKTANTRQSTPTRWVAGVGDYCGDRARSSDTRMYLSESPRESPASASGGGNHLLIDICSQLFGDAITALHAGVRAYTATHAPRIGHAPPHVEFGGRAAVAESRCGGRCFLAHRDEQIERRAFG